MFAALMLLAFAIDQLRRACCPLFRTAQPIKLLPDDNGSALGLLTVGICE